MSNEENLEGAPVLSRRQALTMAAVAGAGIVAAEATGLLSSQSANAAVLWNHPFRVRASVGSTYLSTSLVYWQDSVPKGQHQAIDFTAAGGTAVYSVAEGKVDYVGLESSGEWHGNYVRIKHADGFWSSYAHLKNAPRVQVGDKVWPAATLLGYVGQTGEAYGDHLHFELLKGGTLRKGADHNRIDPAPYVNAANTPLAGSPGVPVTVPPPLGPNIAIRNNNGMSSLYYTTDALGTLFALAGDGRGAAAWLETRDQGLANQLAGQHGNAAFLQLSSFNSWKAAYLSRDPVETA